MDREEAIKWLRHCAESDCDDCAYENQPIEWCSVKMKECVDAVEEALSATNTEKLSSCGDLIRRGDAIEAVANAIWHYPNECYKNLNVFDMAEALAKDALSALPSAETHEIRTETHERVKGGDAEMPSLEQYPYMKQSPNSGADLISRVDAANAVRKYMSDNDMGDDGDIGMDAGLELAIDELTALPSATPTKLLDDGTLKVKTKNGADVNRVLVWGDDGSGGLYYADDRPSIAYFCNGTACDGECDECHHTTDIEHAENFNIINGMHNIKYIETDYRPSGEWIMHIDDLYPEESTQECSNCHEHETIKIYNDNYCPNCGAKMEVEHETD